MAAEAGAVITVEPGAVRTRSELATARLPPCDIALRLANDASLALAPGLLVAAGAGVVLAVGAALAVVEPGAVRIRSALPDTAALPDVDKAFLRANDASRAVCAIIISVLSDSEREH